MYKDFTQTINDDLFRRFFKLWQNVRDGDALPTRKAVTLRDFAPFAPDLLIYELPAPDDLRCRLMGSNISDRVKAYSPDTNWLDLVAGDVREAGKICWGNLFTMPCAGLMQFSTGFLNGTSRISRALLLPMQHAPGVVNLLALATVSDVYNVGDPRDQLIVSHDCFQSNYIDVGFGLPENVPEAQDHKVLDEAFGDRIFTG